MMHPFPRGIVLTALVALAACSGGDRSPTTTPIPEGQGKLDFTIQRLANSTVPAIADSAVIRVWNTGLGINQARAVAIPAPGATTRAVFVVPGGTGYQVAVLPFKRNGVRYAVAGGRTDNITVIPGQDNPVAVNVQPFQIALLGPDSMTSGVSAEILIRVRGGGPINGLYSRPVLCTSLFDTFCNPASVLDDSTFKVAISLFSPYDTAYVAQVKFRSSTEWPTEMNSDSLVVNYPYPALSVGTPLRIPIRRVPGSTILRASIPTAGMPPQATHVIVRLATNTQVIVNGMYPIPASRTAQFQWATGGAGNTVKLDAVVVSCPQPDCVPYPLGAGRTANIPLVAGQVNSATVTVQPYEITALAPDTLISGRTDTMTMRFRGVGSLSNLYPNLNLCMSPNRAQANLQCVPATIMDDSTLRAPITAPTFTADSAAFFQATLKGSLGPTVTLPGDVVTGPTLLRRPVKTASGTTITVSFDRSKVR